jgi:phosphatidylcholine synthase
MSNRQTNLPRWGPRAALLVHLLTASGAGLAFVALLAAIDGNFAGMFAWLGVALFVDAIDGTLARAAKVGERAAQIDGALLDLVVDFTTYVVVPMVALWRSNLLAPAAALVTCLIVTIASGLYFADRRMKTRDFWFRGFPAAWNVAALYLFVFRLPPWINVAILLAATALMFTPIAFVHPLRVQRLKTLTIAFTMVWLVSAALAIAGGFDGGPIARGGLIVAACYFLALPFARRSPFVEDSDIATGRGSASRVRRRDPVIGQENFQDGNWRGVLDDDGHSNP